MVCGDDDPPEQKVLDVLRSIRRSPRLIGKGDA
jgi:hypothetical protein